MIRGLFKEKKISVFYLVVLIGFSLFQVYLFFVLFQFVRYSLDSYYYLKVYLNPQIYSDDPSFLSLFSSSLQEGWNSIKEGSPFFSSEIKYIISSSFDEVYKNTFIFLVAIITSFVSFWSSIFFQRFSLAVFNTLWGEKSMRRCFFLTEMSCYTRPPYLLLTQLYMI